ncbi:uncharacterized protein LOC142181668 [Nicotiana tabacum]|uniref:Uncharacterized protein LOC142181668 n=1 Tax=Nicotiana tabacum TaxID=4097 RepID=A0AC58UNV2_TOBAC
MGVRVYMETKKENKSLGTYSLCITVRASTDHIHTVIDGAKRYIVCLKNKRCSCGQFQLDELPCAHALTALSRRIESYEIPVNPLLDETKWNVPQHITEEVGNPPSGGKRQPERPQK